MDIIYYGIFPNIFMPYQAQLFWTQINARLYQLTYPDRKSNLASFFNSTYPPDTKIESIYLNLQYCVYLLHPCLYNLYGTLLHLVPSHCHEFFPQSKKGCRGLSGYAPSRPLRVSNPSKALTMALITPPWRQAVRRNPARRWTRR
jgi:hypothetical protein